MAYVRAESKQITNYWADKNLISRYLSDSGKP